MKKENKKTEGPVCACGKVDLYEEFLKNETDKKENMKTDNSKQFESSTEVLKKVKLKNLDIK